MSITAVEARACGNLARQVRGLLTGIDRLSDAFDEAEKIDARVAAAKREQAMVEVAGSCSPATSWKRITPTGRRAACNVATRWRR